MSESVAKKVLFEITEDLLDTGLRGFPVSTVYTSEVDPGEGLHYVGYPIADLADLDPEAASQWILEPGGVKVYAWDSDRGVVSHQMPCGTFEGPYPFHDGGKLID